MMKFHLYKDARDEWRWKLIAANNRVIADSGEGYKNEQDCRDMIHKICGLKEEGLIIIEVA